MRQHPLIYGTRHGEVLSELFEGISGPGINPHCARIEPFGDDATHTYTFAYFSQLTERKPHRLATWNYLPGVLEFEAEVKVEEDHLRLELRAQPETRTGHTYWLDHCVGLDSAIFDQHSRYYYFNPEPVEIKFEVEPGVPPEPIEIVRNPKVDSWWENLQVQGEAEPYLLVHRPASDLNLLLYWQDAALLKVRWGHCIHVNPAIIANGEPQSLVGELYLFRAELSDALAFARARLGR